MSKGGEHMRHTSPLTSNKTFMNIYLVTFNNMNVDYIAEIKFLGIQITHTLKWQPHIQLQAGKLCKVAFMIKSLKEVLVAFMIKSLKGVLSPNLI